MRVAPSSNGLGRTLSDIAPPALAQGRKPKIIHVIDSLARGGTETFLVSLLPDLRERYELVLVTLRRESDFREEQLVGVERHCLGYTGVASIPRCVLRLRKLIRRHRPDLIRSQLYHSSIVARLAAPRGVPVVFSIHSRMSDAGYKVNRFAAPLERLTYGRRHSLISVTKDALEDFDQWIGIRGRADVLHNFISPVFFETARARTGAGPKLRLVAVGMLKEVKNYGVLIEALRLVRGEVEVSLDIYGEGHLRRELQAQIDRAGVDVTLKGKRPDIHAVLGDYDLFVMPSLYEGFANAAVEAMASGLPLLVSDQPSFHEITHGNALFFDPTRPETLAALLRSVRAGEVDVAVLSERGIEIAKANYERSGYLAKLDAIYARELGR